MQNTATAVQVGDVIRLGDAPVGALVRWEDSSPDGIIDVTVVSHRNDSAEWVSLDGFRHVRPARNWETVVLLPERMYPPIASADHGSALLDAEGMSMYDLWNSDARVRVIRLP